MDTISNITNLQIQWPHTLIARKIDQLSLVGYTNDWQKRCSGRKLILFIPPPIACVHLAIDSSALIVSEAHQFEIEVCLTRKMYQEELDTFEDIPVV